MSDTMHQFHLRKLKNAKGETVRCKTEAEDINKKEGGTTINPQIDTGYLNEPPYEQPPDDMEHFQPTENGRGCPIKNPKGSRF